MHPRLSQSALLSGMLLAMFSMQTPCRAQWGEMSAADRKVLAALDAPTVCEFDETRLDLIVTELQKRHNVKIRTDMKAFEDFGIYWRAPVSLHAKGISLRSALRLRAYPNTEHAPTCLRMNDISWLIHSLHGGVKHVYETEPFRMASSG